MSRQQFKPNRARALSAAATAMLMVTSAAFAANDAATTDQSVTQETPDRLFRKLDANRDGVVSRDEAKSDAWLGKSFDTADDDRDGRLTADEYLKGRAVRDRTAVADVSRDALLTAKVKAALIRDPAVSGLRVNVKTVDGIVVLTGRVANADEAERARSAARRVDGVTEVRDEFVLAN